MMNFDKTNLLEICDFIGGSQPPKSDFIESPREGYVRLLQIRDFENDEKAVYIPNVKGLRKASVEDVLIGRYGASVGKVLTGKEGSYNVALMKVVPKKEKVHNKFVFYLLKSKQFQKFLKEVSESRAAQAGFSKKDLERFYFHLPDFYKQEKIYLQLDIIQELIDKRIKSIEMLDELMRSIYFEMFGDPIVNNYKHSKIKLSSKKFKISSGLTPSRKNELYFEGSIPWVKSTDINKEIINSTDENITELAIEKTAAKLHPKGSILLAMYGQGSTRGKVALLGVEASTNQACAIINCVEYSNIFLFFTLKCSYEYLRSISKGGNRDNLSLTAIKKVSIINPSLPQQIDFENKFNYIQRLKNSLNLSLNMLQTLFQAVLQNAFNPNFEIDEQPIFKELIKRLEVLDLRGNKKRLQYLLDLFEENKFDNDDDYFETKNKLFDLILENEIEQKLDKDKIILQVK